MLRILVVNHSQLRRKAMALLLAESGLPIDQVFEANDAAEALAVMRDCWVDLMVCDAHLPTMGGLQLVQRMASGGFIAEVPVLIVSPQPGAPVDVDLAGLGVRAWLYEPLEPETLCRVVREVLGLSGAA